MSEKNVAFLIYPMFCNFEVAIALEMFAIKGKKVVTFAIDLEPVACEEGLRVIADKTLDDFIADEYDCVLISGIGGKPDAVLYNHIYIDFLSKLKDRDDILIASISISPVLLAQASILEGKQFCVGMYEEDREEFSFFDYDKQVRAPLVVDKNVITAMGFAYREFAIEIIRKLGYDCKDDAFSGITYPINPDDYIFWANKTN